MNKFCMSNTYSHNDNFVLTFKIEVINFINFVLKSIKFIFITEVQKYIQRKKCYKIFQSIKF